MKLIVFTPANTKSAIGRMAALVTRELVAQGCEVTVVRTEAKHMLSTDVHDFGAQVLPWDDDAEVRELSRSSDACIFHIGNSFEFHEGGVRWLVEFPGLVCLHDFFLGHLFYGWAQTHRAQAQAVLQRWYGEVMAERFFSFSDSESFIDGTREVMPMTEWICSQADGVITHSSWGCGRVMNSCPGPVRVVPLAYDAPGALANMAINTYAGSRILQILTIGHVNPNKRIESVIRAIGLSPLLRNRVNYRLVGAVEPEMMNSLSDLAKRLGVNLVISGEVDNNDLERAIAESDVISCLRWPALEAASASAIEAMLYGKAVIVTDTGFYADIPDSCAIKINHSNEIPGLQSSFEELLENNIRVTNLGKEAQRWASQTFTASNYAMRLVEINEDISRTVPVKRAVESFCDILSRWSSNGAFFVASDLINPLDLFENID
ncbi:glycosyltransferase [Citrobacter sp. Cy070]|uniref:glycosyltransferase n=1 Tax=Citrobacter sp. Cy070 TaxID=2985161 RepID=UPI002576E72C|nr:glycosyltransferase [Citrobacter sp. Cy070]MDM2732980.1 glycosyltransferase [Citrobacter sp. Cy070]